MIREVSDTGDPSTEALDDRRLIHAFRLCTSRRPDEADLAARELLRSQRKQFAEGHSAEQLAELIGVPIDRCLQLTGAAAADFAAWMIVSRVVLNLDETITKS